jgi:hypothetical protein
MVLKSKTTGKIKQLGDALSCCLFFILAARQPPQFKTLGLGIPKLLANQKIDKVSGTTILCLSLFFQ